MNMKFKDLFKVLVQADFYYICIHTVEKGTLKLINSEIISTSDLSSLEKYFDKEVQCIHSMKYNNAYDYNITLYK
jgi:high-affinity Fe2+/Pb2+ permease